MTRADWRAQKGKAAAFAGVGRGPTGVIKSVLDTSRVDGKGRDEIFVDIVEKISCTFSAGGYLQTGQIDGAIQARCRLHRLLHGPGHCEWVSTAYGSQVARACLDPLQGSLHGRVQHDHAAMLLAS